MCSKHTTFLLLLAVSVTGIHLPRQATESVIGPRPNNSIVVTDQSSWPLLNPQQALAALYSKAKATPAAVNILPSIPVPSDVANAIASFQARPALAADSSGADANAESPAKAAAAAASGQCTRTRKVYEWRNFPEARKQQFLNAMKCLTTTPPRSGLPGVRNRWDDLVAIHQRMAPTVHNVGQFLPWHRYFLKLLEMEMRRTCSYTGPMAWWDETRDAGRFQSAPMMTDQFFGRLTIGSPQCLQSGVFTNTECHIGPGTATRTHCLNRGGDERASSAVTTQFVNTCLSYNSYTEMQNCIFFGPHAYGHNAIGGDMSDVYASPSDPLFHIHHSFVNRAWRTWQKSNAGSRLYAIGGSTRQNCGSSCQPTTLDYELSSFGYYPSVRVRDVMDTMGPYLCYDYDY